MHQIKIFKSTEYSHKKLEDSVNEWLKQSGAKVLSITGNIAPQTGRSDSSAGNQDFEASDILLVVHYEA